MASILQPTLFERISIPVKKRHRVTSLMQTLADKPDLAKSVIGFEGYLYPNLYQSPHRTTFLKRAATFLGLRVRRSDETFSYCTKAERKAYKKVLARALSNMVNLQSLALPFLEYGLWPGDIMNEVAIPHLKNRLTSLEIVSRREPFPVIYLTRTEINAKRLQSISILSTQSNLQVLKIPWDFTTEFDWEKYSEVVHMPMLTELTCGWSVAYVLGKRRPSIRTLGLLDYPYRPSPGDDTFTSIEKDWDMLAASVPNLVALKIYGLHARFCEDILEFVVDKFRSLEALELEYVFLRRYDIVSLLHTGISWPRYKRD